MQDGGLDGGGGRVVVRKDSTTRSLQTTSSQILCRGKLRYFDGILLAAGSACKAISCLTLVSNSVFYAQSTITVISGRDILCHHTVNVKNVYESGEFLLHLGLGGDVALQIVEGFENGKNYTIFADNFFSNPSLVKALKAKSMFFVGTFQTNRLKGRKLKSEKDLKKLGTWFM